MNSDIAFMIMAGCTLFTFFEGAKALKKIPPYDKNAQEADRIFNMRAFESEEDVKSKLKEFFRKIERSLMDANLCFAFAYLMISLMSKMTWQWSWKQSFGLTLVFYLALLGITYAVFNENRFLKKDIMAKFETS